MQNFLDNDNISYEENKHWQKIISFGAVMTVISFSAIFSFFVGQKIEQIETQILGDSKMIFSSGFAFAHRNEEEDKKEEKVPGPEFIGESIMSEDNFSAVSVIVRDVKSDEILFEKNVNEERPIASITKLMSALTILERNPDWNATSTVQRDDLSDNHMYAGDTYELKELWQAALIGSSNKAIYTLADAVGISKESFTERMNQLALELGMSQTHFVEPTGLNAKNISTASDLTKLLSRALEHKNLQEGLLTPELDLYSAKRDKKHHIWNTNWILLGWIENNFAKFYGGKTGYIPAAGYNFSMRVGNEHGNAIDVIVLGTNSNEARFTEARDIANWVFDNYQWQNTTTTITKL
jgi:serine-type D-Ala-D-Ala endopeptidase (penicillin-binding protein 7)